jgi:GAF domain-containing protein
LRLLTAAEIARDAASARSLDDLLNRAGRLIRERFGYYHTGIFLLDKNNEYAVLRASPTEAGRAMIENRHQLRVGEVGIVGYVASTGQPRIALDTGQDAAFFDNPLLPKTRSEMALPLIADNVIIGVLDVQSEQPQAFSEEDISIMQVLADQLATAIEKTRLLSELQDNLKELERANQQITREGWKEVGGKKGLTGYHFDKNKLGSASAVPDLAKVALSTGSIAYSNPGEEGPETTRSAAIPVKLRGQTIGALNIRFAGGRIPEDTVRMIESVADRLAIAVENARLVQDSQRRASLEYTISQMSNKIGAATEVDSVLKATAQELGKLLPDSAISVHLVDAQNGSNGSREGGRE